MGVEGGDDLQARLIESNPAGEPSSQVPFKRTGNLPSTAPFSSFLQERFVFEIVGKFRAKPITGMSLS